MRHLIYPFLLPNGLLCAVALLVLGHTHLPAEVQPFLQVFPFAVLFIGILLGWRFNRTRLIYAIGLLFLAEIAVGCFAEGGSADAVFQTTALLLPVNLLLVSWFRERGLLNLRSALWGTFLAAEVFAFAGLIHYKTDLLDAYINSPFVENPVFPDLPLSQPVLFANGFILLIFALRSLRHPAAFDASFFWAHLIICAGFSEIGPQPLRLFLASAGLVLILGLLESSHSLAYRDELTGLSGRRALNEALPKLGNLYTLAMLDIDHFKKFNDTYGHDVGDQVLKMVAGKLAAVRGGGKVFRFGGEEFAVIIPRRGIDEAQPYLEKLRRTVEHSGFIPRAKDRPKKKPKTLNKRKRHKALKVTISIGAAERGGDLASPDDVLKAADKALYKAKQAGRNQVCV